MLPSVADAGIEAIDTLWLQYKPILEAIPTNKQSLQQQWSAFSFELVQITPRPPPSKVLINTIKSISISIT